MSWLAVVADEYRRYARITVSRCQANPGMSPVLGRESRLEKWMVRG